MISLVPVFVYYTLYFFNISLVIRLIAATLTTLFPNYVYAALHILVVPYAIFFTALLITFNAYLLNRPEVNTGLSYSLYGLFSGIAMLFDPILILLPLLWGILILFFRPISLKKYVKLFFIGFFPFWFIAIAPWSIRNYKVHGKIILVKNSFWYAFWQGNNIYSEGTDKLLPDKPYSYFEYFSQNKMIADRDNVPSIDSVLSNSFYQSIAYLPEGQQFKAFKELALKFLKDHPEKYLLLILKRLRYFLWVDPTNPKCFNPIYWGTTFLIWIGIILSFQKFYKTHKKLLFFISIHILAFALFHSLTIYAARFRMPVEWMLLVFLSFLLYDKVTIFQNFNK